MLALSVGEPRTYALHMVCMTWLYDNTVWSYVYSVALFICIDTGFFAVLVTLRIKYTPRLYGFPQTAWLFNAMTFLYGYFNHELV